MGCLSQSNRRNDNWSLYYKSVLDQLNSHDLVAIVWFDQDSIHSGSDKFAVYPIMGRLSGEHLHVKTAGTSYLEALRVVCRTEPALFREIVAFARERFSDELMEELRKVAPSVIEEHGKALVIRHVYVERRMTPLNLYLRDGIDGDNLEFRATRCDLEDVFVAATTEGRLQ